MTIADWREPLTEAFSCEYKPQDYSCDNGVLFTAEAMMLGLITEMELIKIVELYEAPVPGSNGEMMTGVFLRHMTSPDFCSWDDHFGASVASQILALRVLGYMESHGWKLPNGNWIGRMPILKPAIKAGAGKDLNLWDQFKVAAVYAHNSFEDERETSGKMMLFFGRRVMQKHWLTRTATAMWSKQMQKVYGSPAKMFEIYFPAKNGNAHPFVEASPLSFV
jgi:hypothetical protein